MKFIYVEIAAIGDKVGRVNLIADRISVFGKFRLNWKENVNLGSFPYCDEV